MEGVVAHFGCGFGPGSGGVQLHLLLEPQKEKEDEEREREREKRKRVWSVLLCLLVVLPALRRPNKERETNKMGSLGLCFFSCPQILGERKRVFSLSLLYLGILFHGIYA